MYYYSVYVRYIQPLLKIPASTIVLVLVWDMYNSTNPAFFSFLPDLLFLHL